MSGSQDPFSELGDLLSSLCDGELEPAQAARLEELASQSPQSRRFFLQYMQLHGELYWDQAAAAGRTQETSQPATVAEGPQRSVQGSGAPTPISRTRTLRVLLALTAVAAAVLVIVAGWWTVPPDAGQGLGSAASVAKLTGTAGAVWDDTAAPADQDALVAGRTLRLQRGLAEVTFAGGAKVVIQGPAAFSPTSQSAGRLDAGRLAATVPAQAVGFSVRTPDAVVVDLGTEFGVSAQPDGPSEVHVFKGAVDVQPVARNARPRRLQRGEAIRISRAAGGSETVVEIALAEHDFARRLPEAGPLEASVAALRQAVNDTRSLIHHYTFEGASREEKCRDSRGDLNLAEAVMADGRGGGEMAYSAEGYDASTNAVRPFRGVENGNTSGVSLQSEDQFHPPAEMTVELLLTFDGNVRAHGRAIAAAVATRHDQQDCGFFVSVASDGRVVFLMDGDSPWGESDLLLQPGQWYYVAATFQAQAGQTTVNIYAANLSRAERTLRQVARDEVIPGTPASSRLGIGKAFERSTAHAYPWAGALDEVAIYDSILDAQTLQAHLTAVTGPAEP